MDRPRPRPRPGNRPRHPGDPRAARGPRRRGALADVVAAYLSWGRVAGGRRNGPWDAEHAAKRASRLAWWTQALGNPPLSKIDAPATLARAREAFAELAKRGLEGKTLAHYREALTAMANWAREEGWIAHHSFGALPTPDTSPARIRRDPETKEIHALLKATPTDRRMLYELAFASGFRAGELRALDLSHLGPDFCRLPAWADKAGKERIQALWPDLAARLGRYAATGAPRRLYEAAYGRRGLPVPAGVPGRPLVYVSTHPARSLAADCRRAGVERWTLEGVLDFHTTRVGYINRVFDAGADPREAREMARHETEAMTFGYARAKKIKKLELASAVGRLVAGME